MSLTDLAWVAVAQDDVAANGGVLDEARVNHLRYLEGTPKGSTRWIDTGWALAAWARGGSLVSSVEPAEERHPVRADGTVVDATYRVEMLDGRATVVVEARGGTRGTPGAVNTEYAEGLQLILARLKAAGLALADAAVDTRTTAGLPLEQRRLNVTDRWPLVIEDPVELQRRLGAAQERLGKPEGSKGGNSTRRIRLWVEGGADTANLLWTRSAGWP